MAEYCSGSKHSRKGASNPTPTVHEVPKAMPRTLDAANAIDNLQIVRGKGKK